MRVKIGLSQFVASPKKVLPLLSARAACLGTSPPERHLDASDLSGSLLCTKHAALNQR
jgi:hypothetical protein